ncbi:hypothetical protein [Salinimonas iocasae]|uniref:Uncharacterized protein n=1 Tax=Salinimonas iocasae TaxID=2572577 RepID=A0A5B7YAC0_9ALTE|nr:hypothetical protein [Salinimonas iocasae]QCZ92737.1 hypothetical protein FBQ74_04260 [Salinimonas iocasae]
MKFINIGQIRLYSEAVFTLVTSGTILAIWWGVYTPTTDDIVKSLLIIGTVFVPPGYLYRIYKLERARLALKQDG